MLLDGGIIEALNRFAANSDDFIFVVNESFGVEYLNSSALRLFGSALQEVQGTQYADLVHEARGGPLDINFKKVFESGEPVWFENNLTLPDRQLVLDVRLSPIRNGCKSVRGVLGIARDVTERKQREDLISLSRKQWLLAIDGMPNPLAVVGRDRRIQRVNAAMARRLNSTVRDAIGLTCYERFHGATGPPDFCPFANGNGKEKHTAEVMESHLGCDCVSSISPIVDVEGNTVGCLYIARDITEHDRSLAARRSSEESMRKLLKSSEYTSSIQDVEGKYLFFSAMPGGRLSFDLIGKTPFDLFDPLTASKLVGRVKKAVSGGRDITEQIDFTRGGETLRFYDRMSPLRDALGGIKAVVTVSTKIAEIRKVGDALTTHPSGPATLAKRERQILQLLSRGLTSTQVAATLGISRKTVETHRTRIMKKLDLHKTSALVSYAAKAGLLE
ncbi:MAG: PAS domain-containing protein [Syntrophobacteraceae bacterium]